MTDHRPVGEAVSREGKGTAAAGEAGSSRPIPWEEAERRLTRGGWFWLVTVRPDGAPHAMPVFAVWSESALFVASNETTRKSRNLAADGRCVVTTDAGDLHLVVEGEARRVRDEATLGRASGAFEAIYDWPTVVAGEELDAEYGAPPPADLPMPCSRSGRRGRSASPPTASPSHRPAGASSADHRELQRGRALDAGSGRSASATVR